MIIREYLCMVEQERVIPVNFSPRVGSCGLNKGAAKKSLRPNYRSNKTCANYAHKVICGSQCANYFY